jgi:hypothetical protein
MSVMEDTAKTINTVMKMFIHTANKVSDAS